MRGHKVCRACGEVKPYAEFPWNKGRVNAQCRACVYARKRERRRMRQEGAQ